MHKSNIILAGLLITIFGLITYIIFSSPTTVVEPFDEIPFRKEIARRDSIATHWQDVSQAWQAIALRAEDKIDSLKQLKPDIYINHDNQINFNSTASNNQLDSVIRSNW